MRGGQSWSIDVVIGVLIFLLVIGVFYAILTNNTKEDTTDLKISSETVAEKLTSDPDVGFVTDESIDETKLWAFAEKEYLTLKKELGVNQEFCVFFEDENGNIINITNSTDGTFVGIGSSSVTVGGIPCKEI